MKNTVSRTGLFLLSILFCAGSLHAQQTFTLDEVITQAAKAVEAGVSAGLNWRC